MQEITEKNAFRPRKMQRKQVCVHFETAQHLESTFCGITLISSDERHASWNAPTSLSHYSRVTLIPAAKHFKHAGVCLMACVPSILLLLSGSGCLTLF